MKTLFAKFLSVFLLGFLFSFNAQASHFAGSSLTYTCLGNNTYLITMSLYRDCSGISSPTTVSVDFSCTTNPLFNFTAVLNKVPGTGQEVTNYCNANASYCNGGVNFGIQEYIYQAQVTLVPCDSWTFHYTACCRNPITTTSGTGSWWVEATLNNLIAPCNSSPIFSNLPIAVATNGQKIHYNPGIIEPDGDSLSYSFFAPKTTATTTLNYISPYSYTNFLISSTPITLNPVTGDISFTPTTNLVTVMGIFINEWRTINGIPTLIGSVMREVELKIDNFLGAPPVLSGIDSINSYSYNPSDSVFLMDVYYPHFADFNINGYDPDTFNPAHSGHPERFSISWNQGIPQGNFTSYYNGTDSAYAHFSWAPTPADTNNNNLHCFTVTISDEACPYNLSQIYSYCIKVYGINLNVQENNKNLRNEVKIYPNPVHESLVISLSQAIQKSEVSVIDISGRILIQETFSGKTHEMTSIKDLAIGSYLLRIKNKNGEKTLKFIKE